ncbi:class I SAM-dependent methyltransferase [Azospirillum brasilense]|uniref:class I SAM-dependent methyltransferase n=1 Tax=Azospirillum brasilense TaxID=192 RepID=UPI000E68E1F7|nr:methyltransferase domain-containing protein [Azospirillum brasilense]NUB26241.1 methyltransferase domain-containing protein [Azospirillum brasilense]NUB34247.1 methyltransferase domain-containing protein [Azospirillum brasilense]RIV99229.1 methyltransferase domain-containing protein [Azospirillum brasilense]
MATQQSFFRDTPPLHKGRLFFWRLMLEEIAADRQAGIRHNTILDYGCSYGGFIEYARSCRFLANMIGVDVDQNALDGAKSRVFGDGISFMNTKEALNNIKDGQVDLITLNEVVSYIDDVNDLTDIINGKLSSSGSIYILTGSIPGFGGSDFLENYAKQFGFFYKPRSIREIVCDFRLNGFDIYVKKLPICNSFGIQIAIEKDIFETPEQMVEYMYSSKVIVKACRKAA